MPKLPRRLLVGGLATMLWTAALAQQPAVSQPHENASQNPHPEETAHPVASRLAISALCERGFVANHGQADPRVEFQAQMGALTAFVTRSSLVLQLASSSLDHQHPRLDDDGRRAAATQAVATSIEIVFEGCSPAATVRGLAPIASPARVFRGNDGSRWGAREACFSLVRYGGLYPGVDVDLFLSDGQIEYDLVLAPGADPTQVVLRFTGLANMRVANDGSLVAVTPLGPFHQSIPATYQQAADGTLQRIPCRHRLLSHDRAGFAVADYDRSRALVIDPGIQYSTYLGGALDDQGFSLAVDGTGIYVTGTTASSTFPISPGAYDTSFAGLTDIFVAKLDPTGSQLVYSTLIGGAGQDAGNHIAVDSQGAAYVTGWTTSADFPVTPGAFDTTYHGGGNLLADGFAFKLSPAGDQLDYSTFLAGDHDDIPVSNAVGPSGEVYVCGGTASSDFPTTPGSAGPNFGGGTDAFLSKLDPSGSSLIYSTYLGGVDEDDAWEVVADASGNVWVAGRAFSLNFPVTPGAYDTSYNGSFDIFVTRFDPTGSSIVWSTLIGGVRRDEGNAMAIDPSGVVYVAGVTRSYDFPVTHGAYDEQWNGVYDEYVVKLSADGSQLLAATYVGGSNIDYARALGLDPAGNVTIAGLTWSVDFPFTPGAFDSTFDGFIDATMSKLDASLEHLTYSTFLGGPADDLANDLVIDASGLVYLTGATRGSFPVTTAGLDTSWNGGLDVFVTVIDPVSSCPASSSSFGPGWAGTNGIPALTASGAPTLCSSVTLVVGNSLGAATYGRLLYGEKSLAHRTPWDGYLLVQPTHGAFLNLPPAGTQLQLPLDCAPELCGISVYLQALENDPGASRGVSFSRGLELVIGT